MFQSDQVLGETADWEPNFGEMEAVEMLKRSIFAMTLVGFITAAASAEAVIRVDTGVDDGNGNPWGINVAPDGDGTATATISVENTGAGEFGIGAVILDIVADAGLGFDFDFVSPLTADDGDWFFDEGQAVWGGAAETSPARVAPGETLQIGTVALNIAGDTALGSAFAFSLGTADSILANDVDFGAITVASGFDTTFTAVPEPATLALLAIGGLFSLRRRSC